MPHFRGCGTPWRHLIGSQVTSLRHSLFSWSLAAAILHRYRRNTPSFLVLQPPRSRTPLSYCLAASHQLGWFLFRRAEIISRLSATANSIIRQLGQTQLPLWRHAGTPSRVRGNPLVSRWELSLDLSTLDAALDTIRRSPQSPHSSSFSRQSVFNSSPQQLLTPERLLFFTPATSYARASLILHSSDFLRQRVSFLHSSDFLRQSVSNSSLQRLLTPERLLFFSFRTSKISFVFTVLGGLDDAVALLPLFFYATISWLSWDFSSGCLHLSSPWQPYFRTRFLRQFFFLFFFRFSDF